MSETVKAAVMRAVLRLLEPLVRLLLEAGIGVGEFNKLAKMAYARAARDAQAGGDPEYLAHRSIDRHSPRRGR